MGEHVKYRLRHPKEAVTNVDYVQLRPVDRGERERREHEDHRLEHTALEELDEECEAANQKSRHYRLARKREAGRKASHRTRRCRD
jgi:hypothetical protein